MAVLIFFPRVCFVSASQDAGKTFSLLLIFSNLIIDALFTTLEAMGPGGTEREMKPTEVSCNSQLCLCLEG